MRCVIGRRHDINRTPINASSLPRTGYNTTKYPRSYPTGVRPERSQRIRLSSSRNTHVQPQRYPRATGSENSMGSSHAVLHDFCMNIPYGISMIVLGIIAMTVSRAGTFGALVTAVGMVEILVSSMSLKGWKQGKRSTPWTVLGAICSSGVAYISIELWRLAAYRVLSGCIGALSVCISLFLIYNVLSGGNPPPSSRKQT